MCADGENGWVKKEEGIVSEPDMMEGGDGGRREGGRAGAWGVRAGLTTVLQAVGAGVDLMAGLRLNELN